jgi:phospho-N-acetylmuramoyl-pentapeptide-transferase
MFYSLISNSDGGILNLFRYISFRTGGALVTALALYMAFGSRFIRYMREKFPQPIRKEGPQTHLGKTGTPTMGGVLLIASVLASCMLWSNLGNGYVWIMLFTIVSFGAIGFVDDYVKVAAKNAYRGLSGRARLAMQAVLGILVAAGIYCLMPPELGTAVSMPFFKNIFWDIGIIYFLFASLVIVASANSYNLTDGVDGLAAMTGISAFAVFLAIAYLTGRADYSLYLYLPYVPGAGEAAVVVGAIIGALLGFLWFNANPARIFMGDVGSLAVGGSLGVAALIAKSELLLPIAGAIFVAEALSVMIQLGSIKFRGKRVFKMAPLHHHFELKGWSEQTVVIRFWIISIMLALLALSSLKIR